MRNATLTDPRSAAELAALRHDRLRLSAPAVQHEINNALMVLGSNLELIGRNVTDERPRRQLDRALEAVKRMESTVRGFLDAARRDAVDQAATAPELCVKQALPLLRVVLGARHGFDFEMPPMESPPVRLDRGRLDLALLCLVRDAAGRMAPAARIAARVERRGEEVALVLTLPEGAAPEGEAARLLAEAATATGGRIETTADGVTLAWPRARG
jgi:signal transduction histidine kinase